MSVAAILALKNGLVPSVCVRNGAGVRPQPQRVRQALERGGAQNNGLLQARCAAPSLSSSHESSPAHNYAALALLSHRPTRMPSLCRRGPDYGNPAQRQFRSIECCMELRQTYHVGPNRTETPPFCGVPAKKPSREMAIHSPSHALTRKTSEYAQPSEGRTKTTARSSPYSSITPPAVVGSHTYGRSQTSGLGHAAPAPLSSRTTRSALDTRRPARPCPQAPSYR